MLTGRCPIDFENRSREGVHKSRVLTGRCPTDLGRRRAQKHTAPTTPQRASPRVHSERELRMELECMHFSCGALPREWPSARVSVAELGERLPDIGRRLAPGGVVIDRLGFVGDCPTRLRRRASGSAIGSAALLRRCCCRCKRAGRLQLSAARFCIMSSALYTADFNLSPGCLAKPRLIGW